MTNKTETPSKLDVPLTNPHYEGATPKMVGRALLRHAEPETQPKGEDQAESEA